MFERLKRLWELSKPPKARVFTWHGESVSEELLNAKLGYGVGSVSNQPARFLPHIKQKPIEQVLKAME